MNTDPLRHVSSEWRIETEAEPRRLDPDEPDMYGLVAYQREYNNGQAQEFVGRRVRIISEYEANTDERAAQLRKLAMRALDQVFQIDEEQRTNVRYILAELIQNAYRYSTSGPVWLSIVQTLVEIQQRQAYVIDVTVANRADAIPRHVVYEDEVDPGSDRLPDVAVHGRGEIILDALSLQHDRFRRGDIIGAYALIGWMLDDPNIPTAA